MMDEWMIILQFQPLFSPFCFIVAYFLLHLFFSLSALWFPAEYNNHSS